MLDCADQFEFPLNILDLNLPPLPRGQKKIIKKEQKRFLFNP